MMTFVSVGNATQPFERLLEAVLRIAPELPQPVVVQHGNTPFKGEGCIPVPFMHMEEYSRHIGSAGLLILHGGAGSVIHAVKAGRIPVVMPRRAQYGEHVDDHQLEFAHALAEKGKVVVAEEPEQLGEAVRRALTLQHGVHRDDGETQLVRLVAETLARYAGRLK